MRIAAFILLPPRLEDDPARSYVENRALAIYGGFTWLPECSGGWRHPDTGETIAEPMAPLCLACDSLVELALLVALAREAGRAYGEHSVYVQAGALVEIVEVGL